MKPSGPIKRRKPMKRSGRLNPVSRKRRREDRQSKAEKDRFRKAFPECWVPCCRNSCDHVHHMAHRNHPDFDKRANWFAICWRCHGLHHDGKLPGLTLAVQLAIKFLRDPLFFDRVLVLRVRGYAASKITEGEVMSAVECLR